MKLKPALRQKVLLAFIGLLLFASVWLTFATYSLMTGHSSASSSSAGGGAATAMRRRGSSEGEAIPATQRRPQQQKDNARPKVSAAAVADDAAGATDSDFSSNDDSLKALVAENKNLKLKIASLQSDNERRKEEGKQQDNCRDAVDRAKAEHATSLAEKDNTIQSLQSRVKSLEESVVSLKKQMIQNHIDKEADAKKNKNHRKGDTDDDVGALVDEDEQRSFRRHQGKAKFNNAYDEFGAPPDADEEMAANRKRYEEEKGKKAIDARQRQDEQQQQQRQNRFLPNAGRRPNSEEEGSDSSSSSNKYHGIVDSRKIKAEDAGRNVIPIILFAYNRPKSLQKTIDEVLRKMPRNGGHRGGHTFRLFVSQDSLQFPQVTDLLDKYSREGKLHHMIHERSTDGMRPSDVEQGFASYYAIAHHFKFAIDEIFRTFPQYERIIVLEEDLRVGVDFFDYMSATSRLLDDDESLLCVSAWNDNGKSQFVSDPNQLYRTDFFPGLGWMTSRRIWDADLSPNWPKGFWDDWLRQPKNRRDRACIRPEVPRSFMSCDEEGASQGQFCDYIIDIKLSEVAVNWGAREEYLTSLTREPYNRWLKQSVNAAAEVNDVLRLAELARNGRPAKLAFNSNAEFVALAESLGIMSDFKDGVPRTAYKGVVTFKLSGTMVHLYATYRYTAGEQQY